MVDSKRSRWFLTAAALVVSLGACGGDGPTTQSCPAGTTGTFPNCTAVQTCTQTVVESGSDTAPPRTFVYFDFSVPEAGRLDTTVDWTFPTSLIGVYLVPANTCDLAEFNARTCNFLVRSESLTKPRKISTPNFAAGNYRWIVANFNDDVPESFSYQFVLSKGSTCAPLTGGAPAASSLGETGDLPAIRKAVPR